MQTNPINVCHHLIFLCRNALVMGILYIAFQAFPMIFNDTHHFDDRTTGLASLEIGLGMLAAISIQPFWNK